jgi:hypothetical protein
MSRTTPYTYYEQFVVPNFDDYLDRPGDIRRGFNACLTASQLADIMFAYYMREDPSKLLQWKHLRQFRIDLCSREPSFKTVQSVATSYKHLHARGAHYEIDSGGSLDSVSIRAIGSLDVDWSDVLDVRVRRRDGSEASLTSALEAVVRKLWPLVLPREPW